MRLFRLMMAAGLAAAPMAAHADPPKPAPDTPQGNNSQATPPSQGTYEHYEWSMSKGRLGVMVMSLTPELRRHFGTAEDRGVLVARVEPGSAAATAGIAVGDLIVSVRGRPVDTASDVMSTLSRDGKGAKVDVQVVRDRKPMELQVTLTDDAPPHWADPKRSQFMMRKYDDLMRSFFDGDTWFREFSDAPDDKT